MEFDNMKLRIPWKIIWKNDLESMIRELDSERKRRNNGFYSRGISDRESVIYLDGKIRILKELLGIEERVF